MPSIPLSAQLQPLGETGIATTQVEWGGMVATYTRWPGGFDGMEMGRALGSDVFCPVPHWGYVVSGSVGVRYAGGREEIARAGGSFYLAPGHAPFSHEGAEVVEFSPAAPMAEQMAKVMSLMESSERA